MDSKKIRYLAEQLEQKLTHCMRANNDVDKLHNSLLDLINKAKQGEIVNPVDHVPGSYWFLEGGLSKYTDLEAAYSEFANVITMSDSEYKDLKVWAEKRKSEFFGK